MNMSLRDLKAFVALVEERNFTRAAERLHLSQPAFSSLIRSLEESLGARLFERSTRNVIPTPEGKLFETSARRLLGDFEAVVGDFRDHAQRRKGRVGIAALPSIAAGWMPRVLSDYRTQYPGVDLILMDAPAQQCLHLLRSRQVDIAIGSKDARDTDLVSENFRSDRFHGVCRKDHPLALLKRLRVADLAKYPFVHLSHNTSVRPLLEEAFRPVQMRTVLEVERVATLAYLVEADVGITVVPTSALCLFRKLRLKLEVRPLVLKNLKRDLLFVFRKNEPLSTAARAMLDVMKARLRQE